MRDLLDDVTTYFARLYRADAGVLALRSRYRRWAGRELPAVPTSFTERLFHRMVAWDQDAPPLACAWTDKLTAKDLARRVLGEAHIVPVYWSGDDPHELPFGELPLPHILKASHGSRMNRVVRSEVDQFDLIHTAERWLGRNYYDHAQEGQYRDLVPRLLVERDLTPGDGTPVLDYKFWCFGGVPRVVHVDDPLQSINPFFDMTWQPLDLHYRPGCARPALPKPAAFEHMREMAAQLSTGWDFVRVDLFGVAGKVYFSELTFTPNAGGLRFVPARWDQQFGDWWGAVKARS